MAYIHIQHHVFIPVTHIYIKYNHKIINEPKHNLKKYSLIEYDNNIYVNNLPQFVSQILNAKLVNWKYYNQNLMLDDNNINDNDISQIKNIFIHINNIDSNLIDNDELHELNQFNVITDLYKLKYFEHIHKYTNTYSVY